MTNASTVARRAQLVTFDCWNTLLYEPDPGLGHRRRVESLARAAGAEGERAHAALEKAWLRHIELWQEGRCSGALEIARWSLRALDAEESAAPALAADFRSRF